VHGADCPPVRCGGGKHARHTNQALTVPKTRAAAANTGSSLISAAPGSSHTPTKASLPADVPERRQHRQADRAEMAAG